MKLAENGRQANIAAAFASNAHEQMDSLFLKISWGGAADLHTFGDILSRAYSYNAHLRQSGLAKGSVIAIVLKHSAELYTAFLGAMMAGLVPTILPFPTPKQDPEKHWTSHRDLFDLSGIAAVFTYPENIPGIERYLSAQVGYLATPQDVDLTNMDARIEDGELAVLQHSSGTTSLKKGVMLTHTAILNQVRSYSAVLGFDSRSRIVSWLPLYHDMGFIACFLMPMVIGSPVSHLDAFAWSAKPTLLLDEIEAFRGEYVWIPNFAYNHIANNVRPNRQWDLRSLKSLINCSEPCKPSTFETFRAISGIRNLSANALQVCYAMAENVFAVSQTDPHSTPRVICVSNHSFREGDRIEIVDDTHADRVEILSCGKVIDGTVARIIDQNGCPYLEEGRVGEIAITGSSLYTGYYKRPEITDERLIDGWHRTGDVGFLHDGELFVTGRVDDLLIVRGKNIYAHEVENVINALGVVDPGRAVAFTTYSPDKGEAELVVLAESVNQEAELAVRKIVRGAVESSFGIPLAHFRLFPPRTLRKTTSGKLSRKDNLELYQGLQ